MAIAGALRISGTVVFESGTTRVTVEIRRKASATDKVASGREHIIFPDGFSFFRRAHN